MEDVWQPLLATARAAGPVWEKRAEDGLNALRAGWERPDPPAFALLRRAAAAVRQWPHPQVFRDELWNRLGADKPRTGPDQTRMLTAAGLKIQSVRRGEKTGRGYYIEDIQAAAARLPVLAE
jgi:hypothetical protein